ETVADPGCANAYVRTRVWNFSDGCGNTSSNFTQTITVIDNTAPVVTAGTIDAVYPDVASAEAAALAATTSADNCTATGDLIITASTTGDCDATITVVVDDGCGNSSQVTYETAIDNSAPVINTCPSSITVNNTFNTCGANVNVAGPTWTDKCMSNTVLTDSITGAGVTSGPSTGNGPVGTRNFSVGTSTIIYTVSDGLSQATCTLTVTVNDNQTPIVTCPVAQFV